jgi:Tfp pilus assembly protein PilX
MRHSHRILRSHRAAGIALPLALIVLTVLLLLATAAMRSAGFGFIMAGNEQFREAAFLAAETGIEQTYALGAFNPENTTLAASGTVPGTSADTYTTQVVTQMQGTPQGAVYGSSWNAFSTYHFEIRSTGRSSRGATATNVQGVAVIAPAAVVITGAGGP